MDTEQSKVIIIGAGLTGLVTGFYLKKRNIPFVILEQKVRTGGVIQTHKKGGFVYESGPNTAVLGNPEVVELFEDLASGIDPEIAKESAKKRLILKNGKWHALPSGLLSAVGTPLFTFKDKLRVLGEPFRKKGTNPDENLADMVKRRLGKSFLDYAVDPFILGIYSGDPAYLVPKYALPKLYNLEQNYGSFIGGAIKKKKEAKSERDLKATREVFSVKGGLSGLINMLVEAIGAENILLNVKDITVKPEDAVYKVSFSKNQTEKIISAQNIISTIGAYNLPAVFPFFAKEQLAQITNLKYAEVASLALGFDKWQGADINAFGGLIPFKESRKMLGVLFLSSFLSGRAPEGGAMFTVYTGGIRTPEFAQKSEAEIKEIVKSEFTDLMQLSDFNPAVFEVSKHKYAIPQYGADSKQRYEAIQYFEQKYKGIILAGNIRNGIGMADRIKQAKDIAESL